MHFYFNSEPALTIAVHARKTGSEHIVSGKPDADSSLFIETLRGFCRICRYLLLIQTAGFTLSRQYPRKTATSNKGLRGTI